MSPIIVLAIMAIAIVGFTLGAAVMAYRVAAASRFASFAEAEQRRARHREAQRLGREVKGAAVHAQEVTHVAA